MNFLDTVGVLSFLLLSDLCLHKTCEVTEVTMVSRCTTVSEVHKNLYKRLMMTERFFILKNYSSQLLSRGGGPAARGAEAGASEKTS